MYIQQFEIEELLSLLNFGELIHFLGGKLEVEDANVLANSRRTDAFGDDGQAPLD